MKKLRAIMNCYRIGGDVEETRSAASAIVVAPAEIVFLSVASDLSRRASLHEVSGDSSPISFSYSLQTLQE